MFNFQFKGSEMPRINEIIRKAAENRINDNDYIHKEIKSFKTSPQRLNMLAGQRYYAGQHDILLKKRTAIGVNGEITELKNLPNTKIVNNQYAKLVDQKVNYLLGKKIVFNTQNITYAKLLKEIFNADFDRLIQAVGEDCLNCGIGWLYVGYDEVGQLKLTRIKPWQLLPAWTDDEHTKLDYAIRVYPIIQDYGKKEKLLTKVEVFTPKGISKFVEEDGRLLPDGIEWQVPYFYANDTPLGWENIPLIPFKANKNEMSLLKRVKCLQDALNVMLSNFTDVMQEDTRNTILIIKNYDGENLGEFRQNLATYGAVKVRSIDGSQGDVEALSIEVNCENYKSIIDLLKKSIIDNAMGYDAKDDRLSGNPNQMNIQSMYSDIDLDANKMESEFKASLTKLLWFVNKKANFENEAVEIIFNRDILINEGEAIDNCLKSASILSNETIISMHPWVDDVKLEQKRLKKQNEDIYDNTLSHKDGGENEE